MPDSQAERVVLLEAAFRIANERMAAWPERHEGGRAEAYYCECANRGCREQIVLGRAEYERVRRVPSHFFLVPGHALVEYETVVESYASYDVVEKAAEVIPLAEQTDPRTPGGGPAVEQAAMTAAEIEAEVD